jgi:hypothetical protein
MNNQSTMSTLQLQNIDGDATKAKVFCEQALRTSSFTPFLAMTEGSHLILIIYGITVYLSPTAISALKDKAIGFCGNWTATWKPAAILLQQQKAWSWKNPKVVASEILVDHFKANPDDLFFKPPPRMAHMEVKVPLLLAVPSQVIRLILNYGGACKPMQLYATIEDLIQANNLDPNEWVLVLNWCRAVQHADGTNATSSTLAQSFMAIIAEDEVFQAFCSAWLDFNLGQGPTPPRMTGPAMAMPPPPSSHPTGWRQCAS